MAADFHFDHQLAFAPDRAAETLRQIPALPGVFALRGPRIEGPLQTEPYLTRAADLRRRITRILAPPPQPATPSEAPPTPSKRLNLSTRVAHIEYTVTGSDFESTLTLYHASAAIFGLEQARRRLKLRTPYFLRFTTENAHPRVYSTNRLSRRALDNFYGPFPSRAAADRYSDAVLDLFQLRRCHEDLIPTPDHPGCVYQEMKKCLAPCNQAHTPEGAAAYSTEAAAVKRFFDTRGESLLASISLEREQASAAMEFEKAAALHTQWQKVKSAQSLADELIQPIPNLRAILIQKAAVSSLLPPRRPVILSEEATASVASQSKDLRFDESIPEAAIFLLHSGCIAGPERVSTLGVRAVKEQTSVGSSLFAQPLMLQAIPLDPAPALSDIDHPTTLNPEQRAQAVIAALEQKASTPTDIATLSDHLSLLRRWYYRPEKQRTGEIFFPRAAGAFPQAAGAFRRAAGALPREQNSPSDTESIWPLRRILRAAARIALGEPKPIAETQRDLARRNPEDEAQKPPRTKVLHPGRADVERTVPVLDKKFRSRKSAPPPASEH